jgi:dihydroflavonol-4-reductase
MKALVTGANGFTGSHLVKALEKRGDTVVGLVRRTSDLSRLEGCAIAYIYGDITDEAALTEAMQAVDVVFHTAAYVELGLVDAAEMERINVEGTRAVLAAAKAAQVKRLIYCSTIGIYGDTQGKTIDETFVRSQVGFSSAYDRTKYLAQELVNQAVKEGLSIVSVMPSGILGADDPHFGPAIQTFQKGWLKVWVGGDRITGVVHVDDLVDLMLLAADKAETGEHFIASTGDMPTREMFRILSEATSVKQPIDLPEPIVRLVGNVLDPIGNLLNWNPPIGKERVHYLYERCVRVDGSKAKRVLGWQPRSAVETIQSLVQHN